jgi:hypothetical protein
VEGESRNGSGQPIRRRMQSVQRGGARGVDVVLDNVELGDGRKVAQHASRGIRHDRWRSKCVIEQAFVGPPRLDSALSGEREIAETRIAAIDREGLGEFMGEVGRSYVQPPACHSKHHALPSERRQSPANRLQLNDQRRRGLSPRPAAPSDQQGAKACRSQPDKTSPGFH